MKNIYSAMALAFLVGSAASPSYAVPILEGECAFGNREQHQTKRAARKDGLSLATLLEKSEECTEVSLDILGEKIRCDEKRCAPTKVIDPYCPGMRNPYLCRQEEVCTTLTVHEYELNTIEAIVQKHKTVTVTFKEGRSKPMIYTFPLEQSAVETQTLFRKFLGEYEIFKEVQK